MSLVNEVADLLKLVAEGIQNIRSIVTAAKDGAAYLDRHFRRRVLNSPPCFDELGKLAQVLAEASSIVTHFAFTVSGSEVDREPREFINKYGEHRVVYEELMNQLDATRAHSSQIGYYRAGLRAKAEGHNLSNLFGLLGTARAQAKRLDALLSTVYANDSKVIEECTRMGEAVRMALDDVRAR
jgi:hypothetical protein